MNKNLINRVKKLSKLKNLPGYSLTEVLIVIVIMGLLIMMALPVYNGIVTKAKQTEAKTQLQMAFTLQKSFYLEHDRYSSTLNELGFNQAKLIDDGGQARYLIELTLLDKKSFIIKATSTIDFDEDGVFNVWEINELGELSEKIPD